MLLAPAVVVGLAQLALGQKEEDMQEAAAECAAVAHVVDAVAAMARCVVYARVAAAGQGQAVDMFDADVNTNLDTRMPAETAGRHMRLGIGKSARQTEVPVAELVKNQTDTQVADHHPSMLHQKPDKQVLAAAVEQLEKALGVVQRYAAAQQALWEEAEQLQ